MDFQIVASVLGMTWQHFESPEKRWHGWLDL
jgi:hypothetical protein